jgi:ribosomal protein L11 methyltransferase
MLLSGRFHNRAELWRVAATAPDAGGAEIAMAVLGTACEAVSAFETASGHGWHVEGWVTQLPQPGLIEAMLALAWAERRDAPPGLALERVPSRDWLGENQASFPAIAVGRYFIHGAHHRGKIPAGRIGLLIDATTAFGTGEHATTRGCLLALDGLAKRRRSTRVLDMGTGTGILAIAAARTWHRRVLARDIDGEAVRVASRNAARNGVGALLRVRRADGYRERGVRRARFDMVFANILARPLVLMAPDLARAVAPGGVAILSGLLRGQERRVLAAHRIQGLRLARRIVLDGWHTLVLIRSAGGEALPSGEFRFPRRHARSDEHASSPRYRHPPGRH